MEKYTSVIQTFDEFYHLEKKVDQEWRRFQKNEGIPTNIRPDILASWQRCKINGLKPDHKTPIIHHGNSLQERREQNRFLLDTAIPHIDKFFQSDTNLTWFLMDHEGIILESRVNQNYKKKAEEVHFVPGANISEKASGTNATGIALLENKTIQVFAAEHFFRSLHPFIGCASPIRDPFNNEILGVLHMAADKNVVLAHNPYLLLHLINWIKQSMKTNLMEQNIFAVDALLVMNEQPFIQFDNNLKIVRFNKIAEQVLEIKLGDFLTEIIEIPYLSQDFRGFLPKGLRGIYKTKDESEWKIQFHPYKRGSYVFGGIAIFQSKVSSVAVNSRKQNRLRYRFSDILTQDPSMQRVIQLGKKAALSDKTVLITGETGTGKEILAQSIHGYSKRQDEPFVEVNCGAIPEHLVASELFGYEGGAFTGAKSQGKKGKFLLANNGTIFLDEIGDLPLNIQVYLLRVLEERNVIPIGGSKPVPINVRVIAATHKNLESEIKKGNFREDLYHRLNIIALQVPPLRERKGDIPLLIHHFFNRLKEGYMIPRMDENVMQCLCSYWWSGNIRELKNVVEKLIFYTDNGDIQVKDLPSEIRTSNPKTSTKEMIPSDNKTEVFGRKTIDKEILIHTLKSTNGNITEAAKVLNVSRWTIYKRLKDYNLK